MDIEDIFIVLLQLTLVLIVGFWDPKMHWEYGIAWISSLDGLMMTHSSRNMLP